MLTFKITGILINACPDEQNPRLWGLAVAE